MKRESEYQVSPEAKDFFINGYFTKKFKPDKSLDVLLSALREVHSGPKKNGFSWQEKYPYTEDLMPNTYEYDRIFIDFLFEQDLPHTLKEITGFDLRLADIALRRYYPNNNSYMSWHRDTHFYKGQESAGRMPPIYKIIFYAALDEDSSPQLKIIPGSHNRIFRNKYLDYAQAAIMPKKTITSSNDSFFFFNSALFHSVPAKQNLTKPAIRLFYNFCQESQLHQFPRHTKLHQLYKDKLQARPSPAISVTSQETTEKITV